MSKAYQFSQDPNRPNPFADTNAPAPAPGDNPYATAAGAPAAAVVNAGHFQALPHRGTQLLLFGIFGLLIAMVSVPFIYFCTPTGALLATLNFGLTIPAWLMGRSDLKAMNVGAIDASGRSATFAGWLLGLIGTIANFGTIALTIAYLLYYSP